MCVSQADSIWEVEEVIVEVRRKDGRKEGLRYISRVCFGGDGANEDGEKKKIIWKP